MQLYANNLSSPTNTYCPCIINTKIYIRSYYLKVPRISYSQHSLLCVIILQKETILQTGSCLLSIWKLYEFRVALKEKNLLRNSFFKSSPQYERRYIFPCQRYLPWRSSQSNSRQAGHVTMFGYSVSKDKSMEKRQKKRLQNL